MIAPIEKFTSVVITPKQPLNGRGVVPINGHRVSPEILHMRRVESPPEFIQRIKNRFRIDDPYSFQLEAINYINTGKSVVVSAPTGTGKTLVAHAAILKALDQHKEVIYTVPTKALANEKYKELQRLFPETTIGILTGDRKENPDAQIKVMTTEVYTYSFIENIRDSNIGAVIIDEVQNISDKDRGHVWEKAFLNTPKSIQQIALSASMSNGKELNNWLNHLHKEEVFKYVHSTKRAVPIEYSIWNLSTFTRRPEPKHVIKNLREHDLLQCMYVYFNKDDCDNECLKLVKECSEGQFQSLLNSDEQQKVNAIIDKVLETHPSLKFFKTDINALRYGIASHNSGKIPLLKSLIEELIDKNLTKVIFCTETLTTGINKPVRTVVVSGTKKREEEGGMRFITAAKFLQLVGRAGRKIFHKIGTAIILCSSKAEINVVNHLIKSGEDHCNLVSFFNFDYKDLLNFLKQGRNLSELDAYLNSSFAKYLAPSFQHKIKKLKDLNGDFNRDPHLKYEEKRELRQALNNELDYLKEAEAISRSTNQKELNIEAKIKLLEKLGYIEASTIKGTYTVTSKGNICSKISMNNPIFITELITNPEIYKDISPAKFAALISCFAQYGFKKPAGLIEEPQKIYDLSDKHGLEDQVNAIFDIGADLDVLNKEIKGANLPSINYDVRLFEKILDWANETDPDKNFMTILDKYCMRASPNTLIKEIKEVIEFLNTIVKFDGLSNEIRDFIQLAIDTLYKSELIRKEDIVFDS